MGFDVVIVYVVRACVYYIVYVLVSTQVCAPVHAHGDQRRALAALFYNSLPYYFEAGFLPELRMRCLARLATNKPQ